MRALIETAAKRTERVFLIGVELKSRSKWDVQDSLSELAELATKYRVPAITQSRDFPVAGGLMGYGGDFAQSHRRAGIYAGRILKGEKPSDLPVQLVTKVELIINMKAAKLLGREFSSSLVSGADEVIE